MANKINLYSPQWIDMVFEGRYKEYGAYDLRQRYAKHATLGMIFAVILFTLGVSMPTIVQLLSSLAPEDKNLKITEVTTLAEPPPIDKSQPPPPPPPEPPPPLKTTVKFTPPEIKPDEEVPEAPPPTQEELKEADPGTKTQEGDPEGVDESLLEGENNDAPPQIFTIVEQMPTFEGGEAALAKYLRDNIKYPPMERENNIQGMVFLTFVVDIDGSIGDIKVLRGVNGGPNLEKEAIRVVKTMPRWKAGKQNGKPVKVQFNLPVRFALQ